MLQLITGLFSVRDFYFSFGDEMYNSVFLTEKTVLTEVKEFYTEYHSTVFYVVYSSFCCVENSIQERGMLCLCVGGVCMCVCVCMLVKLILSSRMDYTGGHGPI